MPIITFDGIYALDILKIALVLLFFFNSRFECDVGNIRNKNIVKRTVAVVRIGNGI